jgi:hypothetical protein
MAGAAAAAGMLSLLHTGVGVATGLNDLVTTVRKTSYDVNAINAIQWTFRLRPLDAKCIERIDRSADTEETKTVTNAPAEVTRHMTTMEGAKSQLSSRAQVAAQVERLKSKATPQGDYIEVVLELSVHVGLMGERMFDYPYCTGKFVSNMAELLEWIKIPQSSPVAKAKHKKSDAADAPTKSGGEESEGDAPQSEAVAGASHCWGEYIQTQLQYLAIKYIGQRASSQAPKRHWWNLSRQVSTVRSLDFEVWRMLQTVQQVKLGFNGELTNVAERHYKMRQPAEEEDKIN